MTGFDGKSVIVTGAGSGIDRAAALRFVAQSAHGPNVAASYARDFGRPATADEQAAAIVFLASDADINGTILPVDNGWSAV